MPYTQDGRRLKITTPLGDNILILSGFSGHEAISKPFFFQLECVAEIPNAKKVVFDSLLGQKITVEIALPGGGKRFINGSCLRVAQGARDATFTRFVLDLVPEPFLLSQKTQSRIFQHVTIPDILKQVLPPPLDISWEMKGTFEPRDYCVQYRESDFAFASRLMEEEGIYYFFKHSAGSHTMVAANGPGNHSDLPGNSTLIFEAVGGGTREEDRVNAWEKSQELKAGKVLLWDHCFELPHKQHLEAESPIQGAVAAGASTHKLKLGANAKLELYDFPGAYAQRFDGISKTGGEQPKEIEKIFKDNTRTAELRIQEQGSCSVLVHAASNCRQIVSGHQFTLERHFDGNGPWVVYQVGHTASEAADLRSGEGGFTYQNHFTCFPVALPFRPPRVTPIPTVKGTQTAIVVGPPNEEICTDKYGRIKVQFHWDREGKYNSDSSCWIRVATPWAGQRWGMIHIPRIGQEVVVDFLEGDMDQPIVVGSVYNVECMPPYKLPDFKTISTLKSRSTLKGDPKEFCEFRIEDKKGKEQVFIHSQKRMDVRVRGSLFETVHANRHEVIGLAGGTEKGGSLNISVGGDHNLHIGGGLYEGIEKPLNFTVKGEVVNDFESTEATLVTGKYELNARQIAIEALSKISLKVGSSFVVIDLTGVTINGPIVKINSGGSGDSTGDPSIEDPAGAETSDTGEPGFLDRPRPAGGGGRRKRVLHSQHGPAVAFVPATGNFKVGKAITVEGADPAFAQAALADIALIGTTKKGQDLLARLDGSGHNVDIKKRPTKDFNAGTTPTNGPDSNSVATGGTGKGTDTTVDYDPSVWPPPKALSPTETPSDVTLFHELTHADHHTHGTRDGTPRADNFDNQEEFNTISDEQDYRGERTPKVGKLTNGHHEL